MRLIIIISLFTSLFAEDGGPNSANAPIIPGENSTIQSPDSGRENVDVGRYILKRLGEFRRDTFMIDSKTGRLWVMVEGKSGQIQFEPLKYRQIFGSYSVTPDSDDDVSGEKWIMKTKRDEYAKKINGGGDEPQKSIDVAPEKTEPNPASKP